MTSLKKRWAFVGICGVLAVILIFWVRVILGPFLLAFALAYLLNPMVEWLERHGLGRKTSITAVFLGILLIFAGVLFIILPVIYNELAKLTVVLPQMMQNIDTRLQVYRAQFKATGLPSRITLVLDEHLAQGEVLIANKLKLMLANLPEILMSLTVFILSPILAIYFLVDWKRLEKGIVRLVPQRYRLSWQRLLQDINHVIRRFVRGNLVVAIIVGVLIGFGVKLIGMEYAFLIGLICGIFDLIPYFGPLIGAVPSVLLGLIKSPAMAIKIALIILIVQQLEGNVISPKLMGDSVGLHPLFVVFVLLAGGEIWGFWGMLLAVPFAAVLRLIIRHIYLSLVSPEVD